MSEDRLMSRDVRKDASRTSGATGSSVVNNMLRYAAHHVLDWQVPWITLAWTDALWAVDLTLEPIAINPARLSRGAIDSA
jgi:hypothetical protein